MKTRFSTIDIRAAVWELKERFLGLRVVNVYDIDNKTYLIKVAKPDNKGVILIESGNRLHSTEYDWPKNMAPSGFSMKMRKHLRGRRLESVTQLGMDRIVDLQFGSGEAAYHIILELYDRGNIVLTDHEFSILNILRARTDESQDVRFAVREKYPVESARQSEGLLPQEKLVQILMSAKEGDNLKKILNPHLVYGPALIEHCLLSAGLPDNARLGKEFTIQNDMMTLLSALTAAEGLLQQTDSQACKGYIIQKRDKKPVTKQGDSQTDLLTYSEFHPFLYKQHEALAHVEFDAFNKAVDEFFSKMESQKFDMKALQQEKMALKKLDNVRRDHEKRLEALQKEQDQDVLKGQLIEMNLPLVDRAIMIVQSAVANQIDWDEIDTIVKQAQAQGDPVAQSIKSLKLQTNHITLLLRDTCIGIDDLDPSEDDTIKPMKVDIDLGLSAFANARRFYDMKRHASKKEQKTVDASQKAYKSAESKTKQTLKEIKTTAMIIKSRKSAWFEKFLWFISSENYLVIGGRDQQQNELIVKRHLRPGDLYIHADLHGASSVVLKNPTGNTVPPKSMNEAGTMALCSSAAWDAKVVTSAWWVHHDQVSKTAPTGEYLTTGSFMIRGKKNFLPPSYLIYGFGFMFKLDETSIFRHKDERKVRVFEDESSAKDDPVSIAESATESEMSEVSLENKLESMDTGEYSDDEGSEDPGDLLKSEEEPEFVNRKESDESDGKVRQSDGVDADDEINEDDDDDDDNDDDNEDEEDDNSEDAGGDEDDNNEAAVQNTAGCIVKIESSGNEHKALKQSDSVARLADDEEESDDVPAFPDTSIQLHHVRGGKYELHKGSGLAQQALSAGVVYLGDNKPISLDSIARPAPVKTQARISSKQRRDMKKKTSRLCPPEEVDEGEISTDAGYRADREDTEEQTRKRKHRQGAALVHVQPQQAPPKRGQKAKLKKIKEKYGDQDEEERQLRMDILASAGGPKETKQKKGKKGKQQQQQQQQKPPQSHSQTGQKKVSRPPGPLTVEDIKVETLSISTDGQNQGKKLAERGDGNASDEERQAVMEEENITLTLDAGVLDSLTGQPHADDVLLYAVPVCAPYSTLINYKFKVKLIPGSTKRGKAAKLALNMFMHDKTASSREKDLFRSLKDIDLSRNIPGKVKVSAPNLHKQKHK